MIRSAFAASEKGETFISFNMSLAGSASENAVPAILTVETESSKATSSKFGAASLVYQLPYFLKTLSALNLVIHEHASRSLTIPRKRFN